MRLRLDAAWMVLLAGLPAFAQDGQIGVASGPPPGGAAAPLSRSTPDTPFLLARQHLLSRSVPYGGAQLSLLELDYLDAGFRFESSLHLAFAPTILDELAFRELRPMTAVFERIPIRHSGGLLERGFDIMLGALDWSVQSTIGALRGGPVFGDYSPCSPDSTVSDSLLASVNGPVRERGSTRAFLRQLMAREARFAREFEGTYLSTINYQLGYEDLDHDAVVQEQFILALDCLQQTLLHGPGATEFGNRVRDEGIRIQNWRGLDFAILPPAIAAITYYRGLEAKTKIAGTRVKFRIDPFDKIVSRLSSDENLLGFMGVEIETPIRFFKVIALSGLHNGRLELDFIGIGTDFSIARKAVSYQESVR